MLARVAGKSQRQAMLEAYPHRSKWKPDVSEKLDNAFKDGEDVIEDAEPYATVWCDSAEPKSIADFKANGINARGALKTGAHNIHNSIKWLQYRTKIVIDSSCTTAAAREANQQRETITRDNLGSTTFHTPKQKRADASAGI